MTNKYLEKIAIKADVAWQQGLDRDRSEKPARYWDKKGRSSQAVHNVLHGGRETIISPGKHNPEIWRFRNNLGFNIREIPRPGERDGGISVGLEGRARLGKYPSVKEFSEIIDSMEGLGDLKLAGGKAKFLPDMSMNEDIKSRYRKFMLKRRLLQATAASVVVGGVAMAGSKYLEKIASTKPMPIKQPKKPKIENPSMGSLVGALESTTRPKSLREIINDKARKSARVSKKAGSGDYIQKGVEAMQQASQIPRSSSNYTKQRLR